MAGNLSLAAHIAVIALAAWVIGRDALPFLREHVNLELRFKQLKRSARRLWGWARGS